MYITTEGFYACIHQTNTSIFDGIGKYTKVTNSVSCMLHTSGIMRDFYAPLEFLCIYVLYGYVTCPAAQPDAGCVAGQPVTLPINLICAVMQWGKTSGYITLGIRMHNFEF